MRSKTLIVTNLILMIVFLTSCNKDEEPVLLPTLATLGANNITQTTASSGGLISSDGGGNIIERGVCWSKSENPTIDLSTKSSDGNDVGSYTSDLTNLTPGTSYHVRAYATNSAGTAYGNEITFNTLPPDTIGIVATLEISNITANSASSGGLISDDGGASITERGICWDINPNPTIEFESKTSDGDGIGSYTSQLADLKSGTRYYVRAYATNDVGTSYGNEISFITSNSIPELTTIEVSDITYNSVTSGGEISHNGGSDILSRGVVWNTFENPTKSNSPYSADGSGSGSFQSNILDLEPGTLYYIRAYATNDQGTAYGNSISFETEITTPSVNTLDALSITSSSAIVGITLESDGGNDISESGICWSTSIEPSIDDFKGVNSGGFPAEITMIDLEQNTTYYVRSYAINDAGISYGNEIIFKTYRLDLISDLLFYFSDSNVTDDGESGLILNPINCSLTTDRNGQSNAAHSLSKTDSYIELPSCLDLHKSIWTFSVWVKITGAGDFDEPTLLGHQSDLPGSTWKDIYASMKTWDLESNAEYAQLAFAKDQSYKLTSSYLSKNQWYQITVVQGPSSVTFFINGLKVHEDSGTFKYVFECDLPYEISSKNRSSRRFDGAISDIRFYKRDLNIIEIKELYNGDL